MAGGTTATPLAQVMFAVILGRFPSHLTQYQGHILSDNYRLWHCMYLGIKSNRKGYEGVEILNAPVVSVKECRVNTTANCMTQGLLAVPRNYCAYQQIHNSARNQKF